MNIWSNRFNNINEEIGLDRKIFIENKKSSSIFDSLCKYQVDQGSIGNSYSSFFLLQNNKINLHKEKRFSNQFLLFNSNKTKNTRNNKIRNSYFNKLTKSNNQNINTSIKSIKGKNNQKNNITMPNIKIFPYN